MWSRDHVCTRSIAEGNIQEKNLQNEGMDIEMDVAFEENEDQKSHVDAGTQYISQVGLLIISNHVFDKSLRDHKAIFCY